MLKNIETEPSYLLDPAFYLKERAPPLLPKTRFDYSRSLRKALSVPCRSVLFPADRLTEPDFPHFLKETESAGLIPILQIHAEPEFCLTDDNSPPPAPPQEQKQETETSPESLHIIKKRQAVRRFLSRRRALAAGDPAPASNPNPDSVSLSDTDRTGALPRGLNLIFHYPRDLQAFPPAVKASSRSPTESPDPPNPLPPCHEGGGFLQPENSNQTGIEEQGGASGFLNLPPAGFCFFTFVVTKKGARFRLPDLLPLSVLKKTELYFPFKRNLFDPFLTPKQVYRFLKDKSRYAPARPFRGDVYDDRLPEEACLEPVIQVFAESGKAPEDRSQALSPGLKSPRFPKGEGGLKCSDSDSAKTPKGFEQKKILFHNRKGGLHQQRQALRRGQEAAAGPATDCKAGEKDFSIIIPSYNNKDGLMNSLQQLTALNCPKDRFEVIVTDDGSSDGTASALRRFVSEQKEMNVKALSFPRVRERKRGGAGPDFRAGIARNSGAGIACGKRLFFLDGDILIPPDSLSVLKEEHAAGADLIQLKRYHLTKPLRPSEIPLSSLEFKELENISRIQESSYRKPFYEKGFQDIAAPWKYVCSYGLSLSKEDFAALGRFGRTFIYYGFEDVDLGYRMFKAGKTFLLSRLSCFHQFVSREEREGKQSLFQRRACLSKTAKILHRRNPDPAVFEELRSFMRQDRGLSYFSPFSRR